MFVNSNPASVQEPQKLQQASVKLVTVLEVSICSPVQIKTQVNADVDRETGRDETRQRQTRRDEKEGWSRDQGPGTDSRGQSIGSNAAGGFILRTKT